MIEPWIEDARVFDNPVDVGDTNLCQTPDIARYLSPDRTPYTTVMAPKGCGKTFLIKHKRKSLEKQLNYLLIPQNRLVAVAPGSARPFDNPNIEYIKAYKEFWSDLWQLAIALAVICEHDRPIERNLTPALQAIYKNEYLTDPFQIFANLLLLNSGDFFDANRDFQQTILPIYCSIRSPTAVFVDNVDEFFGHHLYNEGRHALHGQLDRDFWTNAQVGLLLASRSLGGQNAHIKIFVSIRSEAFNAAKGTLPDQANLRAQILEIAFRPADLKTIFERNIDLEHGRNLADPNHTDPLARFLGVENLTIRHIYTGKKEPIFDYILRHTFSRPRDLMRMGRRLSAIPRHLRTSVSIRNAVNEASASLCEEFLTETAPHFNWFDQDVLFSQITQNVFTSDELHKLAADYEDDLAKREENSFGNSGSLIKGSTSGSSAVSDLIRCGLMGTIAAKPTGHNMIQRFRSIYEASGEYGHRFGTFPKSERYLVHPLLGSYLRKNFAKSQFQVNSVNVICPIADWENGDLTGFVLQADICGYSEIMRDADLAGIFKETMDQIVDQACDGIEIKEFNEGDRIMLADRSGYLLVRAAWFIADRLRKSPLRAEMRFGLEYDVLRTTQTDDRKTAISSPILQKSARLESASAPGHILMRQHAYRALSHHDVDWPFFSLTAPGDFRLRKTKKGWAYGKNGDTQPADVLVALNLHETSFG